MSRMTVAEIIAEWREDPKKESLIHHLYYGNDVWDRALRKKP